MTDYSPAGLGRLLPSRGGSPLIYIGGTTVVTTRGYEGNHLPIQRADINTFANYLGWAVT